MAFVVLGYVWLLTIGVSKSVKLTYETGPAWSTDGKKLLFSAGRTGNMDLNTLELSMRKVIQLTQTADDEYQASCWPMEKSKTGTT